MIGVQDLRKGVTFELEGELYRVLEFDHYKPGRGTAVIRTKLRNLRSGATINRNFISGDRVQDIRLDHSTVQYMFTDGDFYHFMDQATFDQPMLPATLLEEVLPYLKEGTVLELETYGGEPIGIELPITVDLEVTDAPPGFAGDTATGATKEVTLETGYKVQVPLFVKTGDVIRIDTRTGQYLTRV